jgi:hypothetical protein
VIVPKFRIIPYLLNAPAEWNQRVKRSSTDQPKSDGFLTKPYSDTQPESAKQKRFAIDANRLNKIHLLAVSQKTLEPDKIKNLGVVCGSSHDGEQNTDLVHISKQ